MLFAGFLVFAKKNFLSYFLPFAMGASPYFTALSIIPALLINFKQLKIKLPTNLSYLFIIWFVYACISMVIGQQKITTITEIIQLTLGILFFRYVYNFCKRPKGFKNTCLSILFSGLLLSFLEILIFLTNSNIDTTSFLGVTPHNYGSYYIIFSNIILPFFIIKRMGLRFLIITAGFYAIYINEGRAMQLVAISIIAMELLFYKNKAAIQSLKIISVLFLILFLPSKISYSALEDSAYKPQTLVSVVNFDNNFSNLERLNLLILSYDKFLEKPWGHGVGSSTDIYIGNTYTVNQIYPHPHNTLAFMAVELGIVGIFIYLYLLFMLFKKYISLKDYKKKSFVRNSAFAFFCFTQVVPIFYSGLMALLGFMILGLTMSVVDNKKTYLTN
jgi:O-antigen ligase